METVNSYTLVVEIGRQTKNCRKHISFTVGVKVGKI